MKLDRLVLVNWSQLRPGDYDIANMTLLTGPTGAGKSTMLDGLQTIMTAAYSGIVAYNPGQEEAQQGQRRGKSKRTLESFVVGAEYSRFSRPDGAQGYMAAVFRPTQGDDDASAFTALVAAAARVDDRRDAKLERLELVIVDDAALTVDDFFKDADKNESVAVDEIVRRLKAKYSRVTTYDAHKKDYLCALYGRFRGRTSITWEEAQNAAKAWSQSIAYKPIGSVHDLVRDDILEFDGKQLQESISRISDLMRQVTNLKREGERIAATVGRLKGLKAAISLTSAAFEKQVQYDLLLARMQVRDDVERTAQKRKEIKEAEDLAEQHKRQALDETRQREGVDRNRIDVAARLRGIAAHGEKERLQTDLDRATRTARGTLQNLSKSLLSAAHLDNAARWLVGKPIDEQFSRLKASVEALAQAMAQTSLDRLAALREAVTNASADEELVVPRLLQLAPAFDGANTGITAVHNALVGPTDSVSTAIAAESSALESQVASAKSDVIDLAAKKARLVAGASNYNRDTVIALELIREQLPDATVQVLCDLVEPASEDWQSAIEGYLDNARFNLIVKPEWESRTIDFLHKNGSRCKVIQGKRCLDLADPSRVAPDSIVHELRTDHPIARAYLIEQYGSVVKVQNSAQLRDTARGLTKDGKGSGSRTMFVLEPKNLVFGRKAREQALQETSDRLAQAETQLKRFETLQVTLAGLRQLLQNLKEPVFDAQPLATAAADIEQVRQALSQLDLTEVRGLEDRLDELTAKIQQHGAEIKAAEAAGTLAGERIQQAESVIASIDACRDQRYREREFQLQRLKHLCEANPERNYTVMSQGADDLLTSPSIDVAAVQQQLVTLRSAPDKLLGDVRELLADHNALARQEERFQAALPHLHDVTTFDPYYGPLVNLGRAVGQLHDDLEGIGLYHNRNEVEKAERSFHDVFTKQFCVEIKTRVDDGVRTLRQLNAELQNLKFGTDRFMIDWSKWVPEFEDYHGFFNAVAELADSPETVDLFGTTELSAKHVEVRDRLVKLLLDPDPERAGRELLRIADYRNYRRYEIWNQSDSGGRIALSTWGTGSGGQLETPAYIVRSAVVANRMRFFEKGASLKLLVSDESFSRMDETRAHAVLSYLRDNLGLQVICAMPTKHAGALRPAFDREYSFSRIAVDANGELDFISDCDQRDFKTDRMRELWDKQRNQAREQARLVFDAAELPTPAETGK